MAQESAWTALSQVTNTALGTSSRTYQERVVDALLEESINNAPLEYPPGWPVEVTLQGDPLRVSCHKAQGTRNGGC